MRTLLALATVAVFAAPAGAAEPTPILGIGIVSADQKLVFLPAKEGGIEAIDLATGKIQWENKIVGKPAGASDKVVFTWLADEKKANAFRVFAMDAATGKPLGKSDLIELPDWATTVKQGGKSFRTAAVADDDSVIVVWQAGTHYYGGAAPTEEILAAAKKDAEGVATVDFKTGKTTIAKNGKPREAEFKAGPAGGFANKVGEYEFAVTEELPRVKLGGFESGTTKVTFTVLKGKKEYWKRELAGNPYSPPPP